MPRPQDDLACFSSQLISLKVNIRPRGKSTQLRFCLLMSLTDLIGNWGTYLLPKKIDFRMPTGWGLRQADFCH